jgi:hypothetical protein
MMSVSHGKISLRLFKSITKSIYVARIFVGSALGVAVGAMNHFGKEMLVNYIAQIHANNRLSDSNGRRVDIGRPAHTRGSQMRRLSARSSPMT